MKIKDGIKAGVGFTIGMSLTCVVLKFISEELRSYLAHDKGYMERLKTEDPAGYESLKKYIKHD